VFFDEASVLINRHAVEGFKTIVNIPNPGHFSLALTSRRMLWGIGTCFTDVFPVRYRENRHTDDDVAVALHFVLQHLDWPNMYARTLFVDYCHPTGTH